MTPPSPSVSGRPVLERRGRAPRRDRPGDRARPRRRQSSGRRRAAASRPRARSAPPTTSGRRRNESRRAPSSLGVARPAAARPARRSTSRTPSSASRRRARPRPSRTATSTASSRDADGRGVAKRREHPLPEQAPAHGRHRGVERLEQGAAPCARAERLDQLQVAAGHLVEPEERVARAGTMGRARWGSPAAAARRDSGAARRRRRRRAHRPAPRRGHRARRARTGAPARRRARSGSNSQRSRPRAENAILDGERGVRPGTTTSAGARRPTASASPRLIERLEQELAGAEVDRRQAHRTAGRRRQRDQEVVPVRRRATPPAAARPASPSRPPRGAPDRGRASGPRPARRWRRGGPAATSWRR